MVGTLVQLVVFLVIVIAQVSFFSIAFSSPFANVLVATALILTLARGFLNAWKWIVVMGCFYDLLTHEIVGVSALTLLFFSYGMSLVSRRFLMEHQAIGMVIAVVLMFVSSALFVPLVWSIRAILQHAPVSVAMVTSYAQGLSIASGTILSVLMCMLMYWVIARLDNALDFYGDKVTVKR